MNKPPRDLAELTRTVEEIEALTRRLAQAWVDEEYASATPPPPQPGPSSNLPSSPVEQHRDTRQRDRIGDTLAYIRRQLTKATARQQTKTPDTPCRCCRNELATHGSLCHDCKEHLDKTGVPCSDERHRNRPRYRPCQCPDICCDICTNQAERGRTLCSKCRRRQYPRDGQPT